MANLMIKMLVLSLCLNTFVYLGTSYALTSDCDSSSQATGLFYSLLDDADKFQDDLCEDLKYGNGTLRTNNVSINSQFETVPDKETGFDTTPSEGGTSFLDQLNIVWSFLSTLWAIALAPFYLFFSTALNPLIRAIIGFPLLFINIATIISFIRSGN